jgi:thiamine biosynthesis protein ThiI
MNSIIVHYQEIALKGRNRPWFIGRLVRNIRRLTADLDVKDVRTLMGRLEVVLGPTSDSERVRERISRTFGIANFSMAGRAPVDLEILTKRILADLEGVDTASFRVSVKRGVKSFPMTSPQIEREIGGHIKLARGWAVKLDHPELTVNVELLANEAFYSWGKERGAGGMPTGVSGRVACLLSGGIDSPVAAYRIARRGCSVMLVHFHSYPFLSRASQEKVREIAQLLTRHQMHTQLCLVAFGELQRQIVLSVPQGLRVVIYRRMMLRIADRLARDWNAGALVTGEVIGQVASQTLENLAVIGSVTQLPIIRPLIGMDKDEIIVEAQRIGTYEVSVIPDQDCCQLFTPRNPATKARLYDVEAAERQLPVDEMVEAAVRDLVREEFFFPGRIRVEAPAGEALPSS